MSTRDFAQEYLFQPLGITAAYWDRDPAGIYFGGAWMYFAPRDTARYGYLFLKKGTVEDREILSTRWIE
jgi:CubicO group peptidase (beta-lactamase class C family)